MFADLHHQHHQPDQTKGHVQAVGAHQREEGRQEGAALGRGTLVDQVGKLIEFEAQEAQAEEAGDGQPQQRAFHILLLLAQHGKTEGDGRQQQEGRVDGHQRQVEQLRARGARRIAAAQHTIGGKQGGEDEAVAHQVEPEAQGRAVLGVRLVCVVVLAQWQGCARGACRARGVTDIRHGWRAVVGCGGFPSLSLQRRECRSRACS